MFKGERTSELECTFYTRDSQMVQDFMTKGFHIESGLVTSRKIAPGLNAGNTFFAEPYNVPMSPIESFQHSRVGQAVGKAVERVIYQAKTKVKQGTKVGS